MLKVFNKAARTFLLTNPYDNSDTMKVLPLGTANVPDKFAGDITFRAAVDCGELVVWQEAKEVDKIQKDLEKAPVAEKPVEEKPKTKTKAAAVKEK